MKVYIIPVEIEKFKSIPDAEKLFYIQLGHLCNEVIYLLKLLSFSVNTPTENIVSTNINFCHSLMLQRLLAGKIKEGWDTIQKTYFATRISIGIEDKLSENGKKSLSFLKKYFGKSNIIHDVRNLFGFHYDSEKIKEQISLINDEDEFNIYIAEKTINCFYQFSEQVASKALLNTVESNDFEKSVIKLSGETMDIAHELIIFSSECLTIMITEYFDHENLTFDSMEFVEIENVVSEKKVALPYFIAPS